MNYLPYNKNLVPRAKELRKNMTLAEKKIWHEYLNRFPDRVYRQRPIDNFIVDFYCLKVIRFTNEEVLHNLVGVVTLIEELIPPSPPYSRGE